MIYPYKVRLCGTVFFCCIGSFHSAEMKKYIDTHRYRYVSTISCNKKIEQKYGVRFARKDMPILTNINEGRAGAKMWLCYRDYIHELLVVELAI